MRRGPQCWITLTHCWTQAYSRVQDVMNQTSSGTFAWTQKEHRIAELQRKSTAPAAQTQTRKHATTTRLASGRLRLTSGIIWQGVSCGAVWRGA